MKASFGFGEMAPVPDEEKGGETLPGVRGLEDVAAEVLSDFSNEQEGKIDQAPQNLADEAPKILETPTEEKRRPTEKEEGPRTYTFRFDERGKAYEESEGRLERDAGKLREELERTPEKKREEISIGLRNLGFFVEEAKYTVFAKVFNKISPPNAKEKSVVGKFFSKLGSNSERNAKKAHERIVAIEKTRNRETLANAGYIAGSAVKLWTIASGAVAMPLRAIAMGGMAFAHGADAAKEVRFENEKVVSQTRIEDVEKAAEEAWAVYLATQNKEADDAYLQWFEERKKGERNRKEINDAWTRYELALRHTQSKDITAKDLEKAYRERLPKDILARLEAKTPEQPILVNRVVQGFMKGHIERSVKRLERKVAKIDGNEKLSVEKRNAQRDRLFNRFERRLRDYDRVVSQFGTVDALAMGLRYAEMTGKAATYAPAIFISLDKAFGVIEGVIQRDEIVEVLESLRESVAATVGKTGHAIGEFFSGDGPRASYLLEPGELQKMIEEQSSGVAPKLQSEIAQNLKEQAGIAGATETTPPSVLHQPLSEEAPKEPRFTVSRPSAPFGMPNATVETPSVELEPAVKAPLETTTADSTLAKPASLEQVKTLGAKEAAADLKTIESPAEKPAAATIGEKEIAVEPKVVKPSSGVMEAKMVERATPVTEEELRALKGMRGASEIGPEQIKLATIEKGEGVTRAIKRQLMQHAEQYGYTKESGDMDKWAVLKSKEIAIENGYIRPDGSEVRVLDLGKGKNPAYLLDRDAGGRFHVREFLGGKPSGSGKLSPYEYEWKKPNIPREIKPIPVKSVLKAVNELLARQVVEEAASGIPDELSVRGPMDVIGTKEAAAPVLEHVEVGKLPETKFPEWLTERVEYAKLAETLPEKTASLESIRDNFENYSLRAQENAVGKLDAFEKQLNYLEKNVDTLGLTPSQEDFVEMSKETIDEMREMLKESEEAFKEQLADVGVNHSAYEKAIADKGITVRELFGMEEKKNLDMKKWGTFTNWLHTLKPAHEEVEMKVDDFLRSLTPENFSLKHFAL